MIIIGERINATRKTIARAIEKRDAAFIKKEAEKQRLAGAHYLDLNAGLGKGTEKEDLGWLIHTVQEQDQGPLTLDSSDPAVLAECLPLVENPEVMINSINGEEKRIKGLLPVLKNHPQVKLIALTMDDSGIPQTAEKRIQVADQLIKLVTAETNLPVENIYVDCLVQPISVDTRNGLVFLDAMKELKRLYPGVKTTCGLSNVSFGLPERKKINQYFLVVSLAHGLDSAIIDPTLPEMQEAVCLSQTVLGQDEYCLNYLRFARAVSGKG
ncbi:MAG: dihydropteroate synthase [Candidatus Omnitrophica bacterium]|nr:dihydropteroate synthase [Candidatus Omnitrophota bacterium]